MDLESFRIGRAYGVAVLSAAVLSFTAILTRYLTEFHHMPALVLCLWRAGWVAAVLAPVLWLAPRGSLRVSRSELRFLLPFAGLLAVFNALWTVSVAVNGAAVATVLVYSSAAFTALLGRAVLAERTAPCGVLAIALCFGGCILVADAWQPAAWRGSPVGILTGTLSGLAYAAYTLYGRRAAMRGLDPWRVVLYTFGFAALIMLGLNLLPGGLVPGAAANPREILWLGRSMPGWGAVILLAAGPTLIGFGLYNLSLRSLPAAVVNLIATLEPVFTAASAYLLLGERMTRAQLVGSCLILSGVCLLQVRTGGRSPRLVVESTAWRVGRTPSTRAPEGQFSGCSIVVSREPRGREAQL